MKKLSIEEKAKRYDEALEKSKILYEQGTITESLCYVFPELKESEDENIRKELIKFVKVNIPNEERYIAWLEKQSEKDKLIQELGEYKVKYIQETLEKALTMNSKDDERLRKTTISFLKEFADKGYENAFECIDWLKKQGDLKYTQKIDEQTENMKRDIAKFIFNSRENIKQRYDWIKCLGFDIKLLDEEKQGEHAKFKEYK